MASPKRLMFILWVFLNDETNLAYLDARRLANMYLLEISTHQFVYSLYTVKYTALHWFELKVIAYKYRGDFRNDRA